jgi:hypothetical protein
LQAVADKYAGNPPTIIIKDIEAQIKINILVNSNTKFKAVADQFGGYPPTEILRVINKLR